jgi:anti-sigma factor RsiW
MNCTAFEDWILDQLDGRLPPEHAAALSAHLAACPDCRAFQQAQSELDTALSAQLALAPAPEFSASVLAQLPPPTRLFERLRLAAELAGIASVAAATGLAVAWCLPHAVPGTPWAAAVLILGCGALLISTSPEPA